MKSLTLLLESVLADAGTRCRTSTDRDLKTIAARVEHEGESFLMITLPSFAKDFQEALERGEVAHDHFPGFRKRGGLPHFLGGFLELVFDRTTGRLVDDPNIDAIHAVRQICLVFSKVEVPCSDERVANAMKGYVDCERTVTEHDGVLGGGLLDHYTRVHHRLWASAYSNLDRKVWLDELLPKHGPGSTAEGILGNQKFYQSEWTERLEEFFPHMLHLIPNYSHLGEVEAVSLLEPGAERPVRVVHVPKTLDKPRIIAMEPVAMQYTQQAILEAMVEEIEADSLLSSFITLHDQVPNQVLAKEGSLTGDLATLDLSEASDRVSNLLVETGMARWPHFSGAVQATRSTHADVPGFGVIPLAKFASMGSALCFPVECAVFLTVIFVGIERALGRPLSRGEISSYAGRVRVYGDDLVVPVEFVHSVIDALEAYGFKVNSRKSFWNGKFRESCGKDYFAGEDVTVFKLRQSLPRSRKDAAEIAALVAFRNHAYKAGYWMTVRVCDDWITDILRYFPAVAETSPALGKVSHLGYAEERVHKDLQVPMVKAWRLRSRLRKNSVDGAFALLKWFLKRGDEPFADKDHLERSGRPEVVGIKLGNVRSY